jgi:hypothetical protein
MPSHSPHASRPSTFRAPGWGAFALLSFCCCWRNATSQKLVPFSHRSASRIFIRHPGCIPLSMVTQDGDHQFDGGEKRAGLQPLPHPQLQGSSSSLLGGGRAEPGLYLPHGFVGHVLLQHSGEKALTGLAEGVNFDIAGPSGRKRRQLQHAWFAGSAGSGTASGATSQRWAECGYLPAIWAAVALRASGDRPRRRTLLGQRSCSWAVLPLLRHEAFARRSVLARLRGLEWGSAGGQAAAVVGAEVVAAGEVLVADEIAAVVRALGLGSLALIACPRPSSGDVGEGLIAAASALRSSLLLFGCPERKSLSLLPEWAAASHLGFCRPTGPPMWGVVRTCGGGTGVPFVMAP